MDHPKTFFINLNLPLGASVRNCIGENYNSMLAKA